MSMAFSAVGRILLVSSACDVELSVCIGVHVWGWPNSLSVVRMETAVFALMNNAPSSASAADDMTDLIICNMFEDGAVIYRYFVISCHEHVATCSASGFGF